MCDGTVGRERERLVARRTCHKDKDCIEAAAGAAVAGGAGGRGRRGCSSARVAELASVSESRVARETCGVAGTNLDPTFRAKIVRMSPHGPKISSRLRRATGGLRRPSPRPPTLKTCTYGTPPSRRAGGDARELLCKARPKESARCRPASCDKLRTTMDEQHLDKGWKKTHAVQRRM